MNRHLAASASTLVLTGSRVSIAGLALVALLVGLVASARAMPREDEAKVEEEKTERGLVTREDGASPGYTIISPFSKESAYLLDLEGNVVQQWDSKYAPGLAPYLLPNGNLLRGIQVKVPTTFGAGGIAGGLQEFNWDGELLWEFHLASDRYFHHHDIEPMPNGNILVIAWERVSQEEVLAAGRLETHAGEGGMWPCMILEIEPLPPIGARVVWEWHVWDHLVQDTDPDKPNYGVVADHPELIDVNGDITREEDEDPIAADLANADTEEAKSAESSAMSEEERRRLVALGYISAGSASSNGADAAHGGSNGANGSDGKPDGPHGKDEDGGDEKDGKKDLSPRENRERERADWLHLNGIDYNADLDQIVVSSWHMNEIWIIDHSTTTEEAAGSTGGRYGRGGDLLYRWGNPQTYNRGTVKDRQLFHQHDPQWIPEGSPGEGNITIFNNGRRRPEKEYSSVVEIVPPLQRDGSYAIDGADPFAPAAPHWEYAGTEDSRFFASFISGAHRLPNGNTLICSGPQGRLLEVTRAGEIVWDFLNPFGKIPDNGEPNDFTYGMFRATRYAPDTLALRDKTLEAIDPQPKTADQILAERPKAGEKASEWTPLIDEAMQSLWVNVNCDERSTFDLVPDPDNDDELILKCTGKPTGIMRSARMYENFIVEFEWRHMDEGGNAGFFIWADPLPAVGGPFTRGIEVQVCNLGNGDWFTSHGDIFPIWGATMKPDPSFRISGSRSMPREEDFHVRPTGEWNHYRITALDGAVRLEVNGKTVTAGSSCSPSKGYLCLESEGGEVHFRNMRIWELPSGTHAADASGTATVATEHRTLYNGIDLDGWTIEDGDWKSEDWRMTCAGTGTITVPLPEGTGDLFFDFKREDAAVGARLPFALGERRVVATGETISKWNRVHLRIDDDAIEVRCGDRTQSMPRGEGSIDRLTLTTDGTATQFCSVFAADD